MDARNFYNPIKEYFENQIAKNLDLPIKLIKTHDPIPKDIGFAHPGIYRILKFYSYEPDLIGVVYTNKKKGDREKRGHKLILIKIKTEPPELSDFYHIRLYSEITESDFSFLVSPYNLTKQTKKLIKENNKVYKNYYLKIGDKIIIKEIIVGKIEYQKERNKIKINNIDFDSAISSFLAIK